MLPAGTVAHSQTGQFAVGDRVLVTGYDLGMNTAGGFGQFVRVPASWVVPIPHGLSVKESMIYGTAGFTAAMSVLFLSESVKPEDGTVLVTGAHRRGGQCIRLPAGKTGLSGSGSHRKDG